MPASRAWTLFTILLALIVASWGYFGLSFYDTAIPFYDSVAYQSAYRETAAEAKENGVVETFTKVWRQSGNNVVLYRLYASVIGNWIPHPRAGLYLYLFGLHVIAAALLFAAVRHLCESWLASFSAVAVWLSTRPFGLLRDGVGDQRMDLSSGSFFLVVACLGLIWAERPRVTTAILASLSASLAALHRPVMAASLGGLAILLVGYATLRQHIRLRDFWPQAVAVIIPVALVAGPWFLVHRESLYQYYFEYGPDVGNATSLTSAAAFNATHFANAFGPVSLMLLLFGTALLWWRHTIEWKRLMLVIGITACPLLILILSRSVGNLFVQQAALGIPALILTTGGKPRPSRQAKDGSGWWGIAAVLVVTVITPLRLHKSLASERQGARGEVVAVVKAINRHVPQARIAGFHDLPVNVPAMIMVAKDIGIPLRQGTLSYHPGDFDLDNAQADESASPELLAGIANRLALIKKLDDAVLLPTAATEFRLWQGLFSHRQLPQIRDQLIADPTFEQMEPIGPVQEVYFDIFLVRKEADAAKSP